MDAMTTLFRFSGMCSYCRFGRGMVLVSAVSKKPPPSSGEYGAAHRQERSQRDSPWWKAP